MEAMNVLREHNAENVKIPLQLAEFFVMSSELK